MTDKALLMLGLARRAGKIIYGSESVVLSARQGKAKLAVMAGDASERTKKLMRNKCKSFSVPLFEFSTKAELGGALGKSDISALGISDRNFAKAIEDILEDKSNKN